AREHPRVEPAFLRQVAEPAPAGQGDRAAVPADAAGVEGGEPEHGAHRGGLARAVRAEEPGDLPCGNRERKVVERADGPVRAGEAVQLKPGHGSPSPVPVDPRHRARKEHARRPSEERAGGLAALPADQEAAGTTVAYFTRIPRCQARAASSS